MKKKIYILGLVTAMIVTLGIIFKINHWAGAGILLTGGITILVLAFLPQALISSYKAEADRSKLFLYIIAWLTSFLVFAAMLFKIQHWSGAGLLMLIAIPFPFLVFLPVYIIVTSRDKNHNIYSTVYVLFLLMLISCFTVLLSLNVSREKMKDSYNIVHTYFQSEKALNNLKVQNQSPVGQQIDDLIALTQEYKDLYLKSSGISVDMWKGDLGVYQDEFLFRQPSDEFNGPAETLDLKLLSGLRDLISLFEKTPGCESLASAAPSVFSLEKTGSGNYSWNPDLISSASHPWLLVYLWGLENNLKMLRAAI